MAEFQPTAKVIAHTSWGEGELITMELEYHRFIHSEFMTHRNFSRNAASSRAIPGRKARELANTMDVFPLFWGKNERGMQAWEEIGPVEKEEAIRIWDRIKDDCLWACHHLEELGVHKQIINRLIEPFSPIKVVATGTRKTWTSFLNLRLHRDAQPEIQALARQVNEALKKSIPVYLVRDGWHMPYYGREGIWTPKMGSFEEAALISISSCAQVSYRATDMTLEKARKIFDKLNMNPDSGEPMHASPCEHQATYNNSSGLLGGLQGNFGDGFVQLRKLLENGVSLEEVYV